MAKQDIKVSTAPNDGNGDPIRTAFQKVNSNSSELYAALGANQDGELPAALPVVSGGTGANNPTEARENLGASALNANNTLRGVQTLITGAGTHIQESYRSIRSRGIAVVYDSFYRDDTNPAEIKTSELYRQVFGYGGGTASWGMGGTFANISYSYLNDGSGEKLRMTLNSVKFVVPLAYKTTTSASANMHISSNGTISRSTSSLKYKKDVEPIQNKYADALIYGITPIYYRSLCSGDNPDWSFWGLSAEEVAEIDPRICHFRTQKAVEIDVEVVDYNDDGEEVTRTEKQTQYVDCDTEVEGVMYERFVPHLINVIQRLTKRVEELEDAIKQ